MEKRAVVIFRRLGRALVVSKTSVNTEQVIEDGERREFHFAR